MDIFSEVGAQAILLIAILDGVFIYQLTIMPPIGITKNSAANIYVHLQQKRIPDGRTKTLVISTSRRCIEVPIRALDATRISGVRYDRIHRHRARNR